MYLVKILMVSISPRVKVKVRMLTWKVLWVLVLLCVLKFFPYCFHHFLTSGHSGPLDACFKNSFGSLLLQDLALAESSFYMYQRALFPVSFPLLGEPYSNTVIQSTSLLYFNSKNDQSLFLILLFLFPISLSL